MHKKTAPGRSWLRLCPFLIDHWLPWQEMLQFVTSQSACKAPKWQVCWRRKHTVLAVHRQIQACSTNSCIDTALLPCRQKSCTEPHLRGVSTSKSEAKIVPTLTITRPNSGITKNDAEVDTSPGQGSASGRADTVRCSDADRVIRQNQELEMLPLATKKRC